ncbi:MAG: MBG domain-containing protein [Bacteroidota bacterium]
MVYQSDVLDITPRQITVTANDTAKVYGNTDPALSYVVTSGSLALGDLFTGAIVRDSGENIGKYVIRQGSLGLSSNYTLTYIKDSLTITPRPLSVKADPKAKYFSQADPLLTYQVTSGNLIGTDTFSGSIMRVAGENVGKYAINLGSLSLSSNYALTFVTDSLTISTTVIIVKADPETKVYGESNPSLSYHVVSGIIQTGDTFTGSLTRTSGENVGSYSINKGSLALPVNYTLVYENDSLTITPRPITITANDTSKVYGSSDPALTYSITSGNLIGTDVFSGTLARVSGENTGQYVINQGSLALSANYALTYVKDSFVVTPRSITVTANPKTKNFGQVDPTLTYNITSGSLVSGDSFGGAPVRDSGENVGKYLINQGTLGLSANYTLTFIKDTLVINAATIVVKADAKTKVYGDTTPALTYHIVSGIIQSGDSFSGSLAHTLGDNIGKYAINLGTLALPANYTLVYQNDSLTITPRPITVKADAKSKTFGQVDPELTYYIVTGNLVGTDSFEGGLARISGENIGKYRIIQGDLELSSNYTLTYLKDTLTINPSVIVVKADPKTKVYGSSNPSLTYQVVSGTIQSGHNFTGALTRTSGENVASYSINKGTLALPANYTLVYQNDSLTITPRPVTVAAKDTSKVYGAADPALTYSITSGSLVSGDSFTGSIVRDSGENVGTYIINQGTLGLSSNYALTYVKDSLTITPRPVTVKADPKSKNFGQVDPALTYQITSGNLIGADTFAGNLIRTTGESAGKYAINQGTLTISPNYILNYVQDSLTISTTAIVVKANPKTKVYGEVNPSLTYQIVSGMIQPGDNFTGTLSRTTGENIGKYLINQGSLTLPANYTLTFIKDTLTITPRPITITANDTTKVYGTSDPALSYAITSGNLIGTDTFSGTLTRANGENIGQYVITKGTLGLSANYALTFVKDTLTITPRPITVTANDTSKVYGSSNPALTYSVTNGTLVPGDSFTGVIIRESGETVGKYLINQGTLGLSSNYALTYVKDTFAITPRPVTVKADPKSKNFGQIDPALTYSIINGSLVSGDLFTGAIVRDSGENVGKYSINQGTLALSLNYTLTYVNDSLTINNAIIVVKADPKTKVYGDTSPSLTYHIVSGFVQPGDNFSGSLTHTSGYNIGKYAINKGSLALPANYTLVYQNDSLTITPRPITVKADANTKTFGQVDPDLTYQIVAGNLIGTDTFDGGLARVAGENVGKYRILQGTLELSPNYTLSYLRDTLTITHSVVVVQADAKTKTYGDATPSLTYHIVSGTIQSGHNFTGSLTRSSGENVGKYAINKGSLVLPSNYTLVYLNDSLTITPRPVTITTNDTSKVFGSADPALTYAITSGSLVSGDSFSGSIVRDSGESVGKYVINQSSLALSSNYALTYVQDSLTITPRIITVKANTQTKIYGDINPSLTYQVVSGTIQSGDSFTGSLVRVTGENVGNYIINQGSLTLPSNYTLTFIKDTLTITPRPITVTANDTTKVYGSADPSLSYVITSGNLVNGDSFTGSIVRVSGENVGKYAINQGTLGLTSNYSLTYVKDSLTITPRAITVKADPKAKNFGQVDPALTYAITSGNLIGSDTFSGSLVRVSGESVGRYAINKGSLSLSNNYTLTYVQDSLSIGTTVIVVKADQQTKTYGDANPSLTYQVVSGTIQSGDSFSGSLVRVTGENVGNYIINQGSLTLPSNYTLTFIKDTLTITPRPITVTANDTTKVYGSADPSLSYVITSGNLVSGDSFSGSIVRASGENVGKYAISQGSLALSSNYSLTYIKDSLMITPRPVTIAANDTTKVYLDTLILTNNASSVKLTAGNLVTNQFIQTATVTSLGTNKSAATGMYPIVISGGSIVIKDGSNVDVTANYTITLQPGNLTVSPRVISLAVDKTSDSTSITAGDTITYTIKVTNNGPSKLLSGEVVSIIDQPASGLSILSYNTVNGSYNSNTGALTLNNTFAQGQSVTLAVKAFVNPTFTGSIIKNAVMVKLPVDVINPGDSTDSVSTPIKRWIDLSVAKTTPSSVVTAGDSISYTITVTNKGITTINPGEIVTILDQPGNGLTIASYTTTNGIYNTGAGALTLTTAFATSQSIVLHVRARVNTNFAGDSVRNVVLVKLPVGVVNHGDSTAKTSTKVNTAIIANFDNFINQPIDGAKGGFVGSVLTNDSLNYLPVTNPSLVTISVVNNGGIAGLVINAAGNVSIPAGTMEGTYTAIYRICNPNSICDTAIVTMKVKRGLAITANSVCINDVPYVHYKVIPNFIPDLAKPVHLAWLNGDGTPLTLLPGTSGNPLEATVLWAGTKPDSLGNPTSWPGWCLYNDVWRQCNDGFTGVRPAAKLIISVNPFDTITLSYPPATPNCSSLPPALSRLEIVKSVSSAGPYHNIGDTITYKLVVKNTGNVKLSNVNVIDNNATIVAPVNAIVPQVLAGDSAIVTARHIVTMADMTPKLVTNVAFAMGMDTGGKAISNVSNIVVTPVGRILKLAVDKSTDSLSITAGDSITYNIKITNNGPSRLAAGEMVTILDQPAAGLAIARYTTTSGIYTPANGQLVLADSFGMGQSINLKVAAFVSASYADSSIRNRAIVRLPGDVTNTGDSSDTDTTKIKRWIDLAMTKTTQRASVVTGDTISYTITLHNKGITTLNAGEIVSVIEMPVSGLTINSVTSGNGSYNQTTGALTLTGAFAKGQTISLQVNARVSVDFVGDSVRNIVWVKLPKGVVNHGDSTDTVATKTHRIVNLTVIKTTDSLSIAAGDSTTYAVKVTNNGPSSLVAGELVTIIDQPKAGMSVVSYSSPNGTYNTTNNTLQLNNNFAKGQTIQLNVRTFLIPGYADSTITNAGVVRVPKTITHTGDSTDTVETPVSRWISLSVTKLASKATVAAGDTISYTIGIKNNGITALDSGEVITVIDQPGTGLTVNSFTTNDGQYNSATGAFTLGKRFETGSSIALKAFAKIAATFVDDSVRNTVVVRLPKKVVNHGDSIAKVSTKVNRTLSLSVHKTSLMPLAIAGDSIDYEIVVTNNGLSSLNTGETITITDNPSTGLTIGSYVTSNGLYNPATGALVLNNTFAPTQFVRLKVRALLAANYADSTINNAVLVKLPPTVNNTGDSTDTDTTPVKRKINLIVNKVASTATVVAGDILTYTILAINTGISTLNTGEKIYITDKPDSGLTILSYSTRNGTYNSTNGELVLNSVFSTNQTVILTVTAKVKDTYKDSTLRNVAIVKLPEDVINTGDTTDDDIIHVDRIIHVSLNKQANLSNTASGDSIAYTITLLNTGTSSLDSGEVIIVTDQPSTGLTLGTFTTTKGIYNSATGIFTLTSKLGPTQSIVFNVNGRVAPNFKGSSVINKVTIKLPVDVTNPGDSTDADTTLIGRSIKLAVAKTATTPYVLTGDSIGYTISVTNNGKSSLDSGEVITITDQPQSGLALATFHTSNGVYTSSTGALVLNAKFEPGQNLQLNIKGRVSPGYTGPNIRNSVLVKLPIDITNSGDSTDTDTTPVVRIMNLSVEKTTPLATVDAGDSITYTINVTNNGISSMNTGEVVTIKDFPSTGLSVLSYTTNNGTYNSATQELTLSGTFATGQTVSLTVKAKVSPVYTDSSITNRVVVKLPFDVINNGDSTDSVTTPVVRRVKLAVEKITPTVLAIAGDSIFYTITLTNNGPSTLNAGEIVTILDQPQSGLVIGSYNTANGTYNPSNGALTLNNPIAKGQSITLNVRAKINASLTADSIRNTVLVRLPKDVTNSGDSTDTASTRLIRIINLAITKTTDSLSITAGDTITYLITATHNGISTLNTGEVVSVIEQPAAGLNILSYTSPNGAYNATTGALTLNSPFSRGQSLLLSVKALVNPAYTGTAIKNVVFVKLPIDVFNPGDSTDSITTPIKRWINLGIVKTTPSVVVAAGDSINYTITITNKGITTINPGEIVTIQEQPAAGLTLSTYTTANGSYNPVTGALILTSPFSISQPIIITVRARVNVNFVGDSVRNTVLVKLPVGVVNHGDSTAKVASKVNTMIVATWDNFVNDSIDGAYGGVVGNVLLNDSLNNLRITNPATVAITVVNNGGIAGLTINTLGSLTIPAGTLAGTYNVIYRICDPNNICDTALVIVRVKRGLAITASSLCINDVPYVHYKVVPNFTPDSLNPVKLTWLNGDGSPLTILPASSGNPLEATVLWAGTKPDVNGNPTGWPGWCLTNGVWRQCNDGFTGVRPAAKLIISVNPSDTLTLSYPPATPNCSGLPPAVSRMEVVKRVTSTGTYSNIGDTITYSLVVKNTGNITLTNINVVDNNATLVSPANGNIPVLLGGDSAIVTARHIITPADMTARVVNNIAFASGIDTGSAVIKDSSDTVVTNVGRLVNLTVTKTADKTIVTAGDSLTYTITVTNNGPTTLRSNEVISMIDNPDTALKIMSIQTYNGTYNPLTGNLILNNDFKPTHTIVFTVKAKVDLDCKKDSLKNRVMVRLPLDVKLTGDSTDTSTVAVKRIIDLSIQKTADKTTVIQGEPIKYTITVKNNGVSSLMQGEKIHITEYLPDSLINVSFSANFPTGSSFDSITGMFTLGQQFNAGDSLVLSVQGIVHPEFSSKPTITNCVKVKTPAGVFDNNPANDSTGIITNVRVLSRATDLIAQDQTICKGSTAIIDLSSTSVINPVFTWYTDSMLTQSIGSAPTYFVQLFNTSVYYVTVKGLNKAENTPKTARKITITVNEYATDTMIITHDTTVCYGKPAKLGAAPNGHITDPVFTWYALPSLTVPIATGDTFTTGGITKDTLYYVTIKGSNLCESRELHIVRVTVNRNCGIARLGLSKALTKSELMPDGSFELAFNFVAGNFGDDPIIDVKMKDDLKPVFPNAVIDVISLTTQGTLILNPNYDGVNDIEMLSAGNRLDIGQRETFLLTVNVKFAETDTTTTFKNVAELRGLSEVNGKPIERKSQDGLDPDPGAGNGDSLYVPTPILINRNVSKQNPQIFIPGGFSPNGDKENDYFVIENPEGYTISFAIYNRWGNLLYENANYDNSWDGVAQKGISIGEGVPDGTYFYIVEYTDNNGKKHKLASYITINR